MTLHMRIVQGNELIADLPEWPGPDAAQYVRSHTRIIRRTVTEKTEVVES